MRDELPVSRKSLPTRTARKPGRAVGPEQAKIKKTKKTLYGDTEEELVKAFGEK